MIDTKKATDKPVTFFKYSECRARTDDNTINSRVLYQLS